MGPLGSCGPQDGGLATPPLVGPDCFDTGVDESLKDFKGDTQQRYRTIALWVPQWLLWLRDRNY